MPRYGKALMGIVKPTPSKRQKKKVSKPPNFAKFKIQPLRGARKIAGY